MVVRLSTSHILCVPLPRTPLMLAVTPGHHEVAQLLVNHGAQVDCTDKNLRTALHRAVSYTSTVEPLLIRSAGEPL